ncbi:hypothetical protein JTE90_022647 [Oedothorax gibbosus]|uniref:Uncharacterized protein n=1 Tax=Oedothorax gibbosus TaxID=931172 RepID=A0AAV6TUR8_9ARAC|nr:hypothetical protein JTE90_022647 [Oedothorax gibbosus]
MRKIQYISLILLLIYVVTFFNLFYKSWWYDVQSTLPSFLSRGGTGLTTSTCPLYGFKCPTQEMCDCQSLCPNGEYVPFRVLDNEPIFLMDRQLEPGTYCLPKGIGGCNQKTSYHIFSATGWKCVPRNTSLYNDETAACYSDEAADNTLNVLWDYLSNRPAQNVDYAYERLPDGKLRYRCQCKSKDIYGKRMIESIPFVCSTDYCVKDIAQPLPMMGFNGFACECAMYEHKDYLDGKSPCVMAKSHVQPNNMFVGRVDCTTETSWEKKSIFCRPGEWVFRFETAVGGNSNMQDFVRQYIN